MKETPCCLTALPEQIKNKCQGMNQEVKFRNILTDFLGEACGYSSRKQKILSKLPKQIQCTQTGLCTLEHNQFTMI